MHEGRALHRCAARERAEERPDGTGGERPHRRAPSLEPRNEEAGLDAQVPGDELGTAARDRWGPGWNERPEVPRLRRSAPNERCREGPNLAPRANQRERDVEEPGPRAVGLGRPVLAA